MVAITTEVVGAQSIEVKEQYSHGQVPFLMSWRVQGAESWSADRDLSGFGLGEGLQAHVNRVQRKNITSTLGPFDCGDATSFEVVFDPEGKGFIGTGYAIQINMVERVLAAVFVYDREGRACNDPADPQATGNAAHETRLSAPQFPVKCDDAA